MAAFVVTLALLGSVFVEGWHWRPGGFVVVAGLVFSVGLVFQLVTRNCDSLAYRAAAGIAFFANFGLSWGSLVQWADVNRAAAMYFAVPVVAVLGATVARLRPKGMAIALATTAFVHGLVFLAVLKSQHDREPDLESWTGPELRGFIGNAVIAAMFTASALLFWRAGRPATLRATG